MKKQTGQQIHPGTPWLVLFVGLLLSYLGFYVAVELENRTIQAKHQDIADLAIDALKQELAVSQGILSSIRSLFLASTHVSRSDFKLFTETELKNHPSIQALEWVPAVSHKLRQDYRLRAVRDGLSTYRITELNAQGEMIPAIQRSLYYPVYYVEPLKGNETALGFDQATSATRLSTLNQARLSQQIQITASIPLVQDHGQLKGFLMVQPTFSTDIGNPDKHGAAFNGFALGVFNINVLFDTAMEHLSLILAPLLIEIADITDPQKIDRLHRSQSSGKIETSAHSAWQVTNEIQIANRIWLFTSTATDTFIQQHSTFTRWFFLIIGCTLTLLLTAYLRTIIRRESVVQCLVAQRTQELHNSEEMSRAIIDNAVDAVITIDELGAISLFSPAAVKTVRLFRGRGSG